MNRRGDNEGMVHIFRGLWLSHKKEGHLTICGSMDGPRGYNAKQNKPETHTIGAHFHVESKESNK